MAVDAKICGLVRPEDAAHAAAHGAWRLGVVFAPSPRQVTVAGAREVVAAAAGIPVIGVFARETAAEILAVAERAGLHGAQLHGDGEPGRAATLAAAGLEVWGVATLDDPDTVSVRVAAAGADAAAVLVEPRLPGGSGGRGVPLDAALARAARAAASGVRFVLAGGLRPETLAAAITLVGPDAVDVSSGVELAPGIKDPVRVARFLEIARDARPSA